MNEYCNFTKEEMKYLRMLCDLSARAASGTDFGAKQDVLQRRVMQALDTSPCHAALLTDIFTDKERELLTQSVMVYALLFRGKHDVLKTHFHIDQVCISEEQLRHEIACIEEYVLTHKLDGKAILKKLRSRKKKNPARKLYISDLHFYHDNLNHRMDMRGFSGYEEMNAHMIRRWNEHVSKKDEVYILGDFSISRGRATNEVLRQLNGRKYLIEGNHDLYLKDKTFDRSLFRWIRPYAEIRDNSRQVILSHYPIFCYKGQYRVSPEGAPLTYMLYGHVHNTHDERLVNEFIRLTRQTYVVSKGRTHTSPIPCNMINCFCMFSDYIPLTLDDWIRLDAVRREGMAGC